MDPRIKLNLLITHVDKEGPFLRVWGQSEKNHSIYVEQFLLGAAAQFDKGVGKVPADCLKVGLLVCAKYKDNKYYRAKVVSDEHLPNFFVEVLFVDYGHRDIVPTDNIRSLQNFPAAFVGIPPLASGFILAEAHCAGGDWIDVIFDQIERDLKYREVQCVIQLQALRSYLVKLYIHDEDLGAAIVLRGLMHPINIQVQQAVLLSMSTQKKTQPPPLAPPVTTSNEINTYKTSHLEPGQQYAVYVSFVNDGPSHFSVQLQQTEQALAKLMKEINEINVRLLEDVPLPGTICLARCQEDGNICRAVVTNEVDNQFKVFYVDFGNYETLPLEALYQIPFKYVLPKVMATRLSLNGIEKSSVTIDMLVAFKKFVDNRLLNMKVLPSPPAKKYVIPKCDLWDPESSVTALEVIKRAALHSYPEPLQLTRGFTQAVHVSYVFSCSRFFVQLVSKEAELAKLMEDLQVSCQTADPVEPDEIKMGLPCCSLFEADGLFYRAQIVAIENRDSVTVRYIDYGNEATVVVGLLRQIEGELLTVLRPQAIECCLTGYQNMPVDEERDGLWEELILDQKFTMKVIEMLDKKALVELIDANNYKAASLLLEKLAAANSKVSPLLVQDGNKLEHRKTSTDSQRNDNRDFRQDREGQDRRPREVRDNNRNNWADRQPNERSGEKSWRQDNNRDRDNFRNNERNSNESRPWRQNNENRGGNDRPNKRPYDNNWSNRNGESSPSANEASVSAANDWSKPPPPAPATSSDGWDTTAPGRDDSSGKDFRTPKDRDNFGARNNRWDNDRGGRGDRGDRGDRYDRNREDGFKKRDFRKDGSESGSESGFQQRGPRTSSRNDYRGGGGKFRDKPSNDSFASSIAEDSWNVSALTTPIDAASTTDNFQQLSVGGTEAAVKISWFYDPTHFFCQLHSEQPEFDTLMQEIQEFYKGRKPERSVVGAPIIGLFPEDNVLYRAKVLEIMGGNYKVLYVDFGNIETISKIWPIEKKFMTMPAQAICCGLDGIAPNGESWPNAKSFEKFFQKSSYMARFLYEHESRNYIELWDGQENIASLLVQENLATASVPPQATSEVDIAYLLGQQFRVVLKSVNSLSDIIVALQCGLALNCKMHNLDLASETFEDVLKGYLEQVLIVYVDNILEGNILEVTFYDNDGNKLVILTPDEGAVDIVEPLCPILILNSYLEGFVAHADETAVYVQPNEHADAVANLLEQMFEAYEKEVLETPLIPEEDMLYAIHSSDTNWYRGRCLSFDDNNVTVFYGDYGNTETVPFSELRELRPEFMVPHMLCVQLTLASGAPQDYLEKYIIATIYYGESGWEGVVTSETAVVAFDEAIPEQDVTMSETVTASKTCEASVSSENALLEQAEVVQENQEMEYAAEDGQVVEEEPASTRTSVYVSHIDSPSQFYAQFEASLGALEELQDNIQKWSNDWPVLEKVTVGSLCAAPFSLDQQWYRAEVLDCDDDITTVRFIDFGNTDVISNSTTEIKTLPSNLLSLALYATRCSLKLKPVGEEWSQAAIEFFEKYANAEKVEAEFIIQDEKNNYVDLYADGQNVSELLTKENYAVPCEIDTETKSTCFISHLNSPSEFWVQTETCVDELEWIAEQLSGAEQFPELEDTSPGTLCAALFSDDEMWYRARILSNTVAGIELLFVDYGNSCISNSLRQLPEDVLLTPPLAQKCCLQKPKEVPCWTQEAQNKFSELSADGQTVFVMKKITTGETAVVELSVNGENVVSLILPVTEEGYVKNVESLTKFNVERNGVLSSEHFGLEPMMSMEWNDESSQKFKEQYSEDTLFQIETVGENTVRLYLKGDDIRSNLGGDMITKSQVESTNVEKQIKVNEEILEVSNKEIDTNNQFTENIDKLECQITSSKQLETNDENFAQEVIGSSEIINKDQSLQTDPTNAENPIVDSEVQTDSQFCDKSIPNTTKTVNTATQAVKETNQTGVDSNEPLEEANNTSDSGRHSAESEEALTDHMQQIKETVTEEIKDVRELESHKIPKISEKSKSILSPKEIDKTSKETAQSLTKPVKQTESQYQKEAIHSETIKDSSNTETNTDSTEIEVAEQLVDQPEDSNIKNNTEILSNGDTENPSKNILNINSLKQSAKHISESTLPDSKAEDKITNGLSSTEEINRIAHKETESTESKTSDPIVKMSDTKSDEDIFEKPLSRPSSRLSHDERIVPAVLSRSQSPNDVSPCDAGEPTVKIAHAKSNEDIFERPLSRPSSRLSHDERIVPAVLSRPHSPVPLSSDDPRIEKD